MSISMTKSENRSITTLPILDSVSISTPCPMSWSDLDGDNAKRFCCQCEKDVHDFSELNAAEVESILASGENVCAKIQRGTDGKIITKDHGISRRGWLSTLAVFVSSVLFSGCNRKSDEVIGDVVRTDRVPQILGEVMVSVPDDSENAVLGVVELDPHQTATNKPQD